VSMRISVPLGLSIVLATPAFAFEAKLEVEIPQLSVAEYHRPYLAAWIERPDRTVVTNLALWYDVKNRNNEGDKWLKDLRQWWRRIGRELAVPIDGVSGATRPPGTHTVGIDVGKPPLAQLPDGEYHLVVEAAREVGGRELVKIDFVWPPKPPQTLRVNGESELGAVVLELKPRP
jgi:hypothetical protein